LALLLALVSRGTVRQANVPMRVATTLSRGIVHNVCVSSVVRFRSRVLSPTQNVERRYELWITRHRTIEETFCWWLAVSQILIVFTVNCGDVTLLVCHSSPSQVGKANTFFQVGAQVLLFV
jgi:hypothetical protein